MSPNRADLLPKIRSSFAEFAMPGYPSWSWWNNHLALQCWSPRYPDHRSYPAPLALTQCFLPPRREGPAVNHAKAYSPIGFGLCLHLRGRLFYPSPFSESPRGSPTDGQHHLSTATVSLLAETTCRVKFFLLPLSFRVTWALDRSFYISLILLIGAYSMELFYS